MKISIIAAISDNNAIGKNQQLLWHLPADMKHFKELTTGHAIIMGRKTFESLPNGPLPERKNVVLTTMPEEVFVIGGALVYRQALRRADKMYITRVHHEFENADTFFPVVDWEQWEEVERQDFPADEKNAYPYSFITYVRKK